MHILYMAKTATKAVLLAHKDYNKSGISYWVIVFETYTKACDNVVLFIYRGYNEDGLSYFCFQNVFSPLQLCWSICHLVNVKFRER